MIIGQAKNTSVDVNGNLVISVEYTLTDGSKLNDVLKYSCLRFTKAKLLDDIKKGCEGLMYKIYNQKHSTELAKDDVTNVSYQCTSVNLVISPKDKPVETIIIDDKDII